MNIWLFKPKLREIQLLVPDDVFKKVVEYFRDRSVQLSWNGKLESVMAYIEEKEWESGTG